MEIITSTTDVVNWLRYQEQPEDLDNELFNNNITTTSGYTPEVVVERNHVRITMENLIKPVLEEYDVDYSVVELVMSNALKLFSNYYRINPFLIYPVRLTRAIILEASERNDRWYSYKELRALYKAIYYLYTKEFSYFRNIIFTLFKDPCYICLTVEYEITGRCTFYYIRKENGIQN